MSENWRGNPEVTKKKELWKILDLVNASPNDVFCDLGCGHGKLCIWASKKVKHAIGTESDRRRYRIAKRKTRENKSKNITILNEDYRYPRTLRKLRNCTILYCTNGEGLGFYKKIEEVVGSGAYFVTYYIPPYPIKPEFHDDWIYVMRTPFKVAKNKEEWVRALGKGKSLTHLKKRISRGFTDYKEKILELKEEVAGLEWVFRKRK